MSVKVRESDVEKYLVQKLVDIGLTALKFVPDNCVGMPDRLLILPDQKVLWIELKTDNGRLSKMQRYRHQQLKNSGHKVCIVWSREDVDTLVDMLRNEKAV